MTSPKELHKAGDDVALDDPLNRRILFFREKFTELGRRIQLAFRIFGEYGSNHLFRELGQHYQ
jgi:hypothetical protein